VANPRDLLRRARARLSGWVQDWLRRRGYELALVPSEEEQRLSRLLSSVQASVVLDVGANTGGYAKKLRAAGFEGRIVSFEPLSGAFSRLDRQASGDPRWGARREALGAQDGQATINVASNVDSSSLLPMDERHVRLAPESAYRGEEQITIRRLDSVWSDVVHDGDRAWLKLDVQGYELTALEGAGSVLDDVVGVQAELSLVPLYEGAPDWQDVIAFLDRRGFVLAGFEGGHTDWQSGRMLQADGLFVRPGGVFA
jgi:FkbM family methyltransferase